MSTDKVAVIGGGLGPMAGVFFHKKIIENTKGDLGDQGQLDVVHVSRSRHVAERMAFLAGDGAVSPADGMFRSVKILTDGLRATGADAVISIPCNTFHAPAIFDRFVELLREDGVTYKVLNIIDETVAFTSNRHPSLERVGVLGTVGTRTNRIFHDAFEAEGISVIDVPAEQQEEVRDLILDIKRQNRITPKHTEALNSFLSALRDAGAELAVLGCTELSMIVDEPLPSAIPYIDPMLVLARRTVECCGGNERLSLFG